MLCKYCVTDNLLIKYYGRAREGCPLVWHEVPVDARMEPAQAGTGEHNMTDDPGSLGTLLFDLPTVRLAKKSVFFVFLKKYVV